MKLLEWVFLKWITQKNFTLHLFARNDDKHREFRGRRVQNHPSLPFIPFIFLPFSDFGWLIEFGSCFYYDQYLSSIMTQLWLLWCLLWSKISFGQAFFNFKRNLFLFHYNSSGTNDAKHKRGAAYPMRMKGDEGWICAIQPLKPR